MYIQEWEWDDENIAHLARHRLTPRLVREVAGANPLFRRNKQSRAATHQMIGPDHQGAYWTVCLRQHELDRGRWRAITGWPSEHEEIAWHHRRSRQP